MMTKAYDLAKAEVGTVEWKNGHNPKVLAYYKDAGHAWVKDDETAWCAAFVGAMLKRAGLKGTGELTARSYLQWGEPVDLKDAKEGDVIVFKRGNHAWQGHVAFFVRRSGAFIEVLGGNQSDQVKVSRYSAADLLGVRRAAAALVAAPAPAPAVTAAPVVVPDVAKPISELAPAKPALTWFAKFLLWASTLKGRKP